MGQWNSLHLFDEKKFREVIVPAFRQDAALLKSYFCSKTAPALIESPETLTEERIKAVMTFAAGMSDDFRNHPEIAKRIEQDDFSAYYHSLELNDLRSLLFLIVFSECAVPLPYFRLGYRLLIKNLAYSSPESQAETLIQKIQFNADRSGVFPGEEGIVNWLSANEVKKLLGDFEVVKPKPSHGIVNPLINTYVSELKAFLSVAASHELGLVSCVDIDFEIFAKQNSQQIEITWPANLPWKNLLSS